MTAETDASGWIAFRNRDFSLFCAARFLSSVAIQMQSVAVGWLVYALTGEALALGLVGLAVFLPMVGLALVTGHVADRVDRRTLLLVTFGMMALTALGLLLYATSGGRAAWPIYLLMALFGTARAFANPAAQAIVPNLVPESQLANAIAWSSSIWQTATIGGPALGGLLYAFGPGVVFGSSIFCFAVALCLVLAMRFRAKRVAHARTSWSSLVAGIFFIRSKPVILGAISLDLFAVLLGGATALLPNYARDILLVGPAGLGLLRSMPAAGATAMAVFLAHRPLRRRSGRRMLIAVAIFGVATIAFGFSTNLPLSLFCLFVLGASDMISVYVRQTLVQIETPDLMRGRVAAVNAVFVGASNELGEFESGVVAAFIGAVGAVIAGGIGTILIAALWARWFPALRDRDRLIGEGPG
jgi:MFS family permease